MAKSADFSEQPNILYIVTDQQRYDSLSCVGQWICQTPNLDRLAARGVRFDNAYTTCALCTPARASMLSGLLPHNHRLVRNCARGPLRDLPDDVRLISEDLIDAGYNCGYAGKWHCGMQKVPSTYGFVGMDVPNYGNPYGTDEYRNYIESRGLEAPERIQYVEVGREGGGGTLSGPVEACAPHFIAEFTIELMKGFAEDRRQTGKPFMMFTS
ncbi:MAG: sulfatase-like hydrolase/transferase, partial [Candidatus Latescibacteria bacterium]|nr:sulfatase-like hydrolase/transferase [Candidatus Latescibacterota bacterium]